MNTCSMLQFALTKNIGEATIKTAIKFIERNNLSWDEFACDPVLLSQFGIKRNTIENIRDMRSPADTLYDELNKLNIRILSKTDDDYPSYLKNTLHEKCPSILFASGNIDLLNNLSVGFCGSRKASEKGLRITESCAQQLTAENITVVSGYAAGVDLTAHKSALENGGTTVFVLAEGILQYRKKREIKDYLNSSNHVFVSQFMPNCNWNAGNAMKRNSAIIGLSRAMILVESGKTGGTFAAGEESLRVGCPLFVVDFAQPEVSAEANPYFIASGGQPIRGKNGIPVVSKVIDTVKTTSCFSLQTSSSEENQQLKLKI